MSLGCKAFTHWLKRPAAAPAAVDIRPAGCFRPVSKMHLKEDWYSFLADGYCKSHLRDDELAMLCSSDAVLASHTCTVVTLSSEWELDNNMKMAVKRYLYFLKLPDQSKK